MTLNPSAVRVAGTGEVYVAPEGTTAPTSATAVLPVAWKGLGITSTDGVQFTMSRDTSDIDGWQMSKIRVVTNSEPVSMEFSLMETSTQALKTAFGGGTVTVAGADEAKFTPPKEGENAIVSCIVEFKDADLVYRYYFPRVQVEGEVSFSLTRSDAVSYPVNFGVLANDPKWEMYTNDPLIVPAAFDEWRLGDTYAVDQVVMHGGAYWRDAKGGLSTAAPSEGSRWKGQPEVEPEPEMTK
jgi:hypothetical protein